jgi:phosphoserine aminotransferase
MAQHNEAKAGVLYDHLDQSRMFTARAQPGSRSLMNVCFYTASDEMDSKFVAEATRRGFEGLKGHRSAGGLRASIYNAMPAAGVKALVEFMKEFERANG